MEKIQQEFITASLLHGIAQLARQLAKPEYRLEEIFPTAEHGELIKLLASDWKDLPAHQSNRSKILYYATKIAAGKRVGEKLSEPGREYFQLALASIFNIVNLRNDPKDTGNCRMNFFYPPVQLKNKRQPIHPQITADQNREVFEQALSDLQAALLTAMKDECLADKLLSLLEENFSYLPSSYGDELNNVSLFDQVKITAALSSCAEQYLQDSQAEQKILDLEEQFYQEKMFALFSMDVSGIQKFIYTISSKGALKGLRARSFYLEILMEHLVDELLERLTLSRVNLLYSGGGHSYFVLPNTEKVKEKVSDFEKAVNQWFLKVFGIALYIGTGYAAASANDLLDNPQGNYSNLYREVSKQISAKKMHRYSAKDINELNQRKHKEKRECIICRRMDSLNAEEECMICAQIKNFSQYIVDNVMTDGSNHVYAIVKDSEQGVPMPFAKRLLAVEKAEKTKIIRKYIKNQSVEGYDAVTKLWVGDYSAESEFKKLAQNSQGIERIAVFRADVDNLGTTFVSGFQKQDGQGSYSNLARSSTLSRQLSLFFKYFINRIVQEPKYRALCGSGRDYRQISIVYSGGDDVFLVGAWNDVVEAAVDLRNEFQKFSQGRLTISGGIGLYSPTFPINVMAEEVADLEENSKGFEGKDAISIFDAENAYHWQEFTEQVMEDKFAKIKHFFDHSEERGKNFLYNILELFRNSSERINIARLVYLLARLEPTGEAKEEEKSKYQDFSKQMYDWIREEKDRKQAITAMYLYIYLTREKEAD
ncbi:type III-A CRISPR-associated protein Cas10/Csm1 [Clostridiales bacterium COT073_COT-073]|nr:type III-A CRISPR-associated protein Cas10/Csm1 [Clostridiales bacterium COT073_COT-073]